MQKILTLVFLSTHSSHESVGLFRFCFFFGRSFGDVGFGGVPPPKFAGDGSNVLSGDVVLYKGGLICPPGFISGIRSGGLEHRTVGRLGGLNHVWTVEIKIRPTFTIHVFPRRAGVIITQRHSSCCLT